MKNRTSLSARSFRAFTVGAMLLVSTTFISAASAQHDLTPLPSATIHKLRPLVEVDRVSLPPVNLIEAQQQDEADADAGLAPRFAVPQPVNLTPENSGTWEAIDANTSVWRLVVGSGFAWHINLGFTNYHLPADGQLFIYTPNEQYILRAFTAADNNENNQLWTPPLPGDLVVIELTVPNRQRPQVQLTLGSINAGYKKFGPFGDPNAQEGGIDSGSCNIDVVCGAANNYPEIDQWRLQIPAIAVISTGGSRFCSGYMVNNTSNDRTPFFMTAAHCGINSGNAASLVTFWNYQNSFCRTPNSAQSGQAGNGSLAQFNTGAVFRASNSASDFTLVQLNQSPNPAWGVTFAGWDRSGANSPSGSIIHHPNTDEKRFTFYSTMTTQADWPCASSGGAGSHVRAFYTMPAGDPREAGTTEPGSSGSPIFDNNKRVIGQLHGGPASCSTGPTQDYDCYGRISASWTGGGTNATRLSNWLDAAGTGAMFVDTLGPGLTVNGANVTHQGPVGGSFSNNPTVYNISNTSGNNANYSVSILGGGTAPLLLDGGAGPVNGSLANNTNVNVTVSLGAGASSLPAGSYATTVRFQDTTNNLTVDRIHTLQVGQVSFSVNPAGGLNTSGPTGGPFNANQVYTVTNTNVNAATIRVERSSPWISLNGGSGPVDLVLAGNGSTGNVTVAFSNAANSLPSGLHNGSVSFTNITGGGSGSGSDTTRPVSVEVGSYNFSTSPNLAIPDSNPTGISSTINIPESFTIADIDVRVHVTHTWVGDLRFVLSHNSTPVAIIDRPGMTTSCCGCSNDNYVNIWIDDEGTGGAIENMCQLNLTSPPNYTPNVPLSTFDGMNAFGAWTLTITDGAGSDVGTLLSWGMKLVAVPPPPPACPADMAPPGGDSAVGVPDLLYVISNWGSCGSPCPADIAPAGGDGSVGVPDLLMVISNWGSCP